MHGLKAGTSWRLSPSFIKVTLRLLGKSMNQRFVIVSEEKYLHIQSQLECFMSAYAGKQGFVDYFVSYSLNFFSKKPKSLNVCIKIDQLIQLMAYSWNFVFMSAVTVNFLTMIICLSFSTPLPRFQKAFYGFEYINGKTY